MLALHFLTWPQDTRSQNWAQVAKISLETHLVFPNTSLSMVKSETKEKVLAGSGMSLVTLGIQRTQIKNRDMERQGSGMEA